MQGVNPPIYSIRRIQLIKLMSFANLKKQSRLGSLTSKLTSEIEKMNKGTTNGADERLWKLEVDKAGNGYAVIRFLPAPDGEELPWAKVWSHAFQGPGGWYIENSLTTLGQKDPVSEYNRLLWNSGSDDDKDQARKQKRKLSYISNIYVVKDPANPQNEGKVFLYKFGKKIFDKITAAMQPEFEDEEAIDPFDFWQGANFKLKAKNVAGYRNYDSSEFAAQSPLLDDDEAMEGLWKKQASLQEFVAADQFKSYEDLKKRLGYVLGNKTSARPTFDEDLEDLSEGLNKAEQVVADAVSATPAPVSVGVPDEEEDDTLSYFAKLASE